MDSSQINNIFLRAMQPVVDVFWTIVWSTVGSSVTVPTTPKNTAN